MKPIRTLVSCTAFLLLLVISAPAQNPASDAKHFEKDGLSFDYPSGWQLSDQSTAQFQMIQVLRGDGYAELRVRAPREWLKSPEKEAHAKKLIQDSYVEGFIDSLQQNGWKPIRSSVTTEIAGANAEGTRVRAVNPNGEHGGMDSYYRVISDRFVNLSQIGSESDIAKSAAAWDMIRTSIKVEPQTKPTPTPTPSPKPAQ